MAKNERQHTQNLAKAGAGTGARKRDIDRTLAMTRMSTASMGKFDRVLDGEKKLRGVKRKVRDPASLVPHANSLLFRPSSIRLKSPSMRRGALIWPLSNRSVMVAARRRKRRNGRLLGMVRGTWLMCARRCVSLLEVRELLRSRVNRVQMAGKTGRESGREGLLL